jgi:hypothetical protein
MRLDEFLQMCLLATPPTGIKRRNGFLLFVRAIDAQHQEYRRLGAGL